MKYECNICKQTKDESLFHKMNQKNVSRSVKYKCKYCVAVYQAERQLNPRVIARRKETNCEYRKNNKEKIAANQRKYKKENRDKANARESVARAVKSGRLEKLACSICGGEKTEAHHPEGYSKENQLVVMWLCRKHHAGEHSQFNM